MTNEQAVISTWIYNLKDYRQIFDIKDSELDLKILDYPGGIASFNAEMHQLGFDVVSTDVLYQKNESEMRAFAENFYVQQTGLLNVLKERLQQSDPEYINAIVEKWQLSKDIFLNDYATGKSELRYREIKGLNLDFEDHEFELALCSDFMFHSESVHTASPEQHLQELCRVAEEVRIFPLLDEHGNISENLGPVMLKMQADNYGIEIREVPYTKIKGGNAMLRVWATECVVD